MSKENTDTKDDPAVDPTAPKDQPVVDVTPKAKDKVDDQSVAPKGKVYSQEEVQALLEKARTDEKKKVYPELDKLKKAKEQSSKQIQALESQLSTRQSEIDDIRSGKTAEIDSISRELAELREQNKRLEQTIDNVANAAAERVRVSELNSFREQKLREAGLKHLAPFVVGESEEEILQSIEQNKEREAKILETAKLEARTELSATLPRPLAPDGSQGRSYEVVSPKDRQAIARKKPEEYRKIRDQLLKQAMS